MTDIFFFRDGSKFTGDVTRIAQKPRSRTIDTQDSCSRCGGRGGSDSWKFTGWTCFKCGGSGIGPWQTHRLFTAEELAKVNAQAEKRNAKKVAAAKAEAEAKRIAIRQANRHDRANKIGRPVIALIGQVFKVRHHERARFAVDVVKTILERSFASPEQANAIVRCLGDVAAADKVKDSDWIGRPDERLTVKVRFVSRRHVGESAFGSVFLTTLHTVDGNILKSWGVWPGSRDTNEVQEITCTVKKRGDFKGIRETVITRIKLGAPKSKPRKPKSERRPASDATHITW